MSTQIIYSQEGTPEVIRGHDDFNLVVSLENNQTQEPVDGVEVYLYETKSDALLASATSMDGSVSFDLQPLKEYEIRTCNPNYLKNGFSIFECAEGDEVLCTSGAFTYNYVAAGGQDKPVAFFLVTLRMTEIQVGSVYELSNVYYDLDKATLRPNGKEELDELAAIMNRNKSISIELSSHTDSRATESYNADLSQRRANACYKYLMTKGIDKTRVTPKGYGESVLVNNCSDNIDCTDQEHQKNRRTEIKVLAYQPLACKPSLNIDFKAKDLKNDPENVSQTRE